MTTPDDLDPLRRRGSPSSTRSSTSLGEPAYRARQLLRGPVRAAPAARRAHEHPEGAARPPRRRAARSRSPSTRCSSPTTTRPRSGCGARPTAPRSRPCSCATRRARRCASRRRPGARWAARSARPARPASSATSSAGEIVEQVLRAQHASPQRVSNVVFMGMGEPLANPDAVLDACTRLHDDVGLSARHLTVSTVGVVPGIERLTEFELPSRSRSRCTRPTTRCASSSCR